MTYIRLHLNDKNHTMVEFVQWISICIHEYFYNLIGKPSFRNIRFGHNKNLRTSTSFVFIFSANCSFIAINCNIAKLLIQLKSSLSFFAYYILLYCIIIMNKNLRITKSLIERNIEKIISVFRFCIRNYF